MIRTTRWFLKRSNRWSRKNVRVISRCRKSMLCMLYWKNIKTSINNSIILFSIHKSLWTYAHLIGCACALATMSTQNNNLMLLLLVFFFADINEFCEVSTSLQKGHRTRQDTRRTMAIRIRIRSSRSKVQGIGSTCSRSKRGSIHKPTESKATGHVVPRKMGRHFDWKAVWIGEIVDVLSHVPTTPDRTTVDCWAETNRGRDQTTRGKKTATYPTFFRKFF